MNESYKNRLGDSMNRLNAQLDKSFKVYLNIEEEKAHHETSADKWSIIQILNHLQASEQLSLKYLAYKLEHDEEIPELTLKNKVNTLLLFLAFGSPLKFKSPENNGLSLPAKTGDMNTIHKSFKSSRADLQELIDQIQPKEIRKAWFKHPYAGRMDLIRMLWFFRFHFKRHHNQIMKILAKAK
jgi:hypothetical protein